MMGADEQISFFTGRTFHRPMAPQVKARLEAAQAVSDQKNNQALAGVQDLSPSLARYLRPQSAFQWWTLPYLSSITPQYIQNILIAALSGNHLQVWQLFDMMIDTNPEIAACIGEYIDGILQKKIIFEPYHEEDEQPTPSAIEKCKVVSAALRNLRPDPASDENALKQTIRDIAFSRFHGQSILQEDWFDTFGTGQLNRISIPGLGNIAAPRATLWIHPVCYAYDITGRLGLRIPPDALADISKSAKGWKPGALPDDYGLGNALSYTGFTGSPRPASLMEFPENEFLIAITKFKTGSALAGSCLRPLAWWWCVSNFAGDWLLDLAQIFGIPFRKATYKQGTGEPQKAEAREMLQNMGSRGWCLLDERVDIQFEKATDSGGQSPQAFLVELAERQFRKVILRQTMTGLGHGGAPSGSKAGMGVEERTKTDCIQAGADGACEILRSQSARHVLQVNYGEDSELPFISLQQEESGNLEDAQIIQALAPLNDKLIGVNYVRKLFSIPAPATGEDTLGSQPPPEPVSPMSNVPDPKSGEPKPGEAADELEAGDVAGHDFHGNQWTDEQLAIETKPLREKMMTGDEVVFRKADGSVQRGYLGSMETDNNSPDVAKHSYRQPGTTKKDYTEAHKNARFEIEHAEVVENADKPGTKILARTGEKTILPLDKIRMPTSGFKQREFSSSNPLQRQSALYPQTELEAAAAAAPDAPTEAYQEKALQQYSQAFAEDIGHVLERLAAIREIKDDALFKTKLETFLTHYPQLKKDVLADPAAARALQPIIATALANGLARESKAQSSKSKVEN